MSKFTFFTILFSLVVIVIVGQLVLRDALFPQEFKTQVLTEETENIEDQGTVVLESLPIASEDFEKELFEEEKSQESQEEEAGASPTSSEISQAVLTDRLLNQTGFSQVKTIPFSGKLFELFEFGSFQPKQTISFQGNDDIGPVGIFTEFEFSDEISAQELYSSLQNKTKVYVDLRVNETNSFGDRSFFMNHRKKPEEAFLVIRMRNFLYAFAYVKIYHPRVKTLISLLYSSILDRQ